jgi:hypothetical protein
VFASLIRQVRELQAAVEAGEWKRAADLFIDLQRQAFDLAFGPQLMGAAAPAEDRAELKAAVKALESACKTAQAPAARGRKAKAARGAGGEGELEPAAVGKLGDGRLLKLIETLLPFILKLF